MLTVSPQEPETTYTLVLSTGDERGDELSEPDAPVLVTLLAVDGRAFLHRCECAAMAGVRGERSGRDTLRLRAPQLGVPAAVWVAPERGTWKLRRANVSCADVDGGSEASYSSTGGTELRPAAPEVTRTPAERTAARQAGLRAYGTLKTRLVGVTAALALPGALLAAQLGGQHAALPFLLGAIAGIGYLTLLEQGVDSLPGSSSLDASSSPSPNQGDGNGDGDARRVAQGTGASARLAVVAALAVAAAKLLAERAGGDVNALRADLAAGAAGFLQYKLAVLLVGLVWQEEIEEEEEKEEATVDTGTSPATSEHTDDT